MITPKMPETDGVPEIPGEEIPLGAHRLWDGERMSEVRARVERELMHVFAKCAYQPEADALQKIITEASEQAIWLCNKGNSLSMESSFFEFERKFFETVDQLQLDAKDYLQAALKQPSLFCYAPATIAEHIRLIIDLYKRELIKLPTHVSEKPNEALLKWLCKNPLYLSLASENLLLRLIGGYLLEKTPKGTELLTIKRHQLEKAIRDFIASNPERLKQEILEMFQRGLEKEGVLTTPKSAKPKKIE